MLKTPEELRADATRLREDSKAVENEQLRQRYLALADQFDDFAATVARERGLDRHIRAAGKLPT